MQLRDAIDVKVLKSQNIFTLKQKYEHYRILFMSLFCFQEYGRPKLKCRTH